MKKIVIENLKNISYLEFELPDPGVWLLTGENGCGKTTLLAAIRRIGVPNAFAIHFPSSQESERVDDFSQSQVTYFFGTKSVTYARRDVRWVPLPRNNADVLRSFNYPSVEFVGATPDRITPREDEFTPNRINSVNASIIDAANKIFSTSRFTNLRIVNVTRGPNPAYVFVNGQGAARRYISERNFSIGELCVLKLLKTINDCPDNSLLLIDELEMAIHPSAQVKLFAYLKEVAARKNLTVLFSTHSVTLIKSAERKKILFIKKDGDRCRVITGPYPSVVLGSLASVEERAADLIVYVEDSFAEAVARPLLNGVVSGKLGEDPFAVPTIAVVPVGGFREVVSFLARHDALHRPGLSSYALLDRDVKDETLRDWRRSGNHEMLAWFQRNDPRIKYLPWTPEVGLFEYYVEGPIEFRDKIRSTFNDNTLHLHQDDGHGIGNLEGGAKRNACKQWVRGLTEFLAQQTVNDAATIKRGLGAVLARRYLETSRNLAMRDFASIF